MLSVIYAECHKQAVSAECRYAEWRFDEFRGAIPFTPFVWNLFQIRILGDGTHDDRRGSRVAESDAVTDVAHAGKDRVVRPSLRRGGKTGVDVTILLHRRL